eukprot:scaffold9879_cov18-Tisochrysis_lutea.AAC.2
MEALWPMEQVLSPVFQKGAGAEADADAALFRCSSRLGLQKIKCHQLKASAAGLKPPFQDGMLPPCEVYGDCCITATHRSLLRSSQLTSQFEACATGPRSPFPGGVLSPCQLHGDCFIIT